MATLYFGPGEVAISAENRRSGAAFRDAVTHLPAGKTPIGYAVAAQFPAILAMVEAAFVEETGEDLTIVATEETTPPWAHALAEFLKTTVEQTSTLLEKVPDSRENARTLAMRFANDQLRQAVLPAHYASKRFRMFVVENGDRRQFAMYPGGDRDAKPSELDGLDLRTRPTPLQQAARPGQLSRMGVGPENRRYRSVTTDKYLYNTPKPEVPGWGYV